ncbi:MULTISPECIES: MerR family transcriptional regulator [Methylobacterium]|uniref:MerR family transcriptional regulator n=1 Tax=Methylobacterium TaxID=407 RepID=UPI0013ECE011|nr:MerR family transcriptional regulator [Methylobacterium sp. DB0501]NGM35737.1 MerR family transcriptional regulator [Methylobacterium sp. DB0501]
MTSSLRCLTPAQAGAALGVSAKALRLYEQHGLLTPDRTRTGWRCYDAATMARAAEIVALRRLGLSLAQVARVLDGEPADLDAGLAAHEADLRATVRQTTAALDRVRALRADLAQGHAPSAATLARALAERAPLGVGFALPWPWGGEWFALPDLPALSFLAGPLGSGKTRLARRLAEALPDAAFLGLDRLRGSAMADRLAGDAALADRVEHRLAWLAQDGATRSEALAILLVALESEGPAALVIDTVEEGLDAATQVALMAHLRLRGTDRRALVLMTRSSSILDLDALEPSDLVILCPANHSVPLLAVPHPGGRGYEAVATCLAPPEVRARTAGIVAMRPAWAEA